MKINWKRFQKKIKYILISFLGWMLLMSNFPNVSCLYYFLFCLIFLMVTPYYFLSKKFLSVYWISTTLFSNNKNSIQNILQLSSISPFLIITFIHLYLGKITLKISILCIINWLLMRILYYVSYQEDVSSGEI